MNEPSTWCNWSGAVRCRPAAIETPASEAAIATVFDDAGRSGRVVRPVGSGHSSSSLCETDGVLLSLERWTGIESLDAARGRACIRGGTVLHDLGGALLERGLALENLGDIDRQTLAGALATGTHGTGISLGNLATRVVALRLLTPVGEALVLDESDPERLRAARISLGVLGVVSTATLQLLPAYRLHERVARTSLDAFLDSFETQAARHRHFEGFYFPRHDFVETKSLDPTAADSASVGDREGERIGWSSEILPSVREQRFHEMEYAVPAERGLACVRALVARIRARHPDLAWPLELRTLAADDAWLSPAFGRPSYAISIHEDGRKPHAARFADLEPIFWEHGGRPHWGKWHRCDARRLAPLYPRFESFLALRRELDPGGRLLGASMRVLLGG